jgi:hypothetical protein
MAWWDGSQAFTIFFSFPPLTHRFLSVFACISAQQLTKPFVE